MKKAIVNYGSGGWYPRGSARLKSSMQSFGFDGDFFIYDKLPKGCPTHQQSPYAFKPHLMQYARARMYEAALWCDSSIFAVNPIDPIFEKIEKQGYYFCHNGFNCAQTLTDNALKNLVITRDEAEQIPELTGCVMGLKFSHPKAVEFLETWMERSKDGTFVGNWKRDEKDSTDPRFLFSRHDQPVASVIAWQLGMREWEYPGEHFMYWKEQRPNTVCLCNQGM